MAHFRCAACHARVWCDDDGDAQAAGRCPGCGGPLEAVGHAEELIGLRALRTRLDIRPSIAEHVREAIARNDAARRRRLRSARPNPPPRDVP
jgi:NAD-dependent SIR2 family protein deacetylase